MASVTNAVELTRLPPWSRTSTSTVGENATPGTAFDGGTRKPTFDAGPTVMLNEVDVVPVRPLAVAVRVYPVPALSTLRSLNVATPPDADRGIVPDRVAA